MCLLPQGGSTKSDFHGQAEILEMILTVGIIIYCIHWTQLIRMELDTCLSTFPVTSETERITEKVAVG